MHMFETIPLSLIEKDPKEAFRQKLDRIQKLKQTAGESDELRDKDLFRYLSSGAARRGAITEIPPAQEKTTDQALMIPTDTGIVADKNQALATDHLFGCMAVFIKGQEKNLLAHLTPSSNLPYRNYQLSDTQESPDREATAQKIIASLDDPTALETCQMLILANMGTADSPHGKFFYQDMLAIQEDLVRIFSEAGAKDIRSVELPLDDTLLYYSPEDPETLHVFGKHASYDQDGKIVIDTQKTDRFAIELDPETPLPFHIERPGTKTETV